MNASDPRRMRAEPHHRYQIRLTSTDSVLELLLSMVGTIETMSEDGWEPEIYTYVPIQITAMCHAQTHATRYKGDTEYACALSFRPKEQ